MHIAQVIPYSGRAQGGPVLGLAAYSAELVRRGHEVSLLSVARESDGPQMEFDPRVRVLTSQLCRFGAFRRSPELRARAEALRPDIVHSHCLFMDVNCLAAQLAEERGVPHLISPCGHLQAGALGRSRWKKLLAGAAFQSRALRKAQCLHAKSDAEYRGIRDLGYRNPIVVFPNPVPPPPEDFHPDAAAIRARYGLPQEKRLLLFLGRIHPVKGLVRLISAWSAVKPLHEEWHLVLAGPDEAGFQRHVEEQIRAQNLQNSVSFTGALNDDEKWQALAAAELFIMPSDFENFGLSIAEALLARVPVITTDQTPWKELPKRGAGWRVPCAIEPLAEALREALALRADQLAQMGERGRALAEPFSPELVGGQLVATYDWLLGAAPEPECLRED